MFVLMAKKRFIIQCAINLKKCLGKSISKVDYTVRDQSFSIKQIYWLTTCNITVTFPSFVSLLSCVIDYNNAVVFANTKRICENTFLNLCFIPPFPNLRLRFHQGQSPGLIYSTFGEIIGSKILREKLFYSDFNLRYKLHSLELPAVGIRIGPVFHLVRGNLGNQQSLPDGKHVHLLRIDRTEPLQHSSGLINE